MDQQQPLIIPSCNNNLTNNNNIEGHDNDDDLKPINGVYGFLKEFFFESYKLWYLAAPAIFNNVCQYGIGMITSMFAGHLGNLQLAALSMTTSVVAAFGYGILVNTFIINSNFKFFSLDSILIII